MFCCFSDDGVLLKYPGKPVPWACILDSDSVCLRVFICDLRGFLPIELLSSVTLHIPQCTLVVSPLGSLLKQKKYARSPRHCSWKWHFPGILTRTHCQKYKWQCAVTISWLYADWCQCIEMSAKQLFGYHHGSHKLTKINFHLGCMDK